MIECHEWTDDLVGAPSDTDTLAPFKNRTLLSACRRKRRFPPDAYRNEGCVREDVFAQLDIHRTQRERTEQMRCKISRRGSPAVAVGAPALLPEAPAPPRRNRPYPRSDRSPAKHRKSSIVTLIVSRWGSSRSSAGTPRYARSSSPSIWMRSGKMRAFSRGETGFRAPPGRRSACFSFSTISRFQTRSSSKRIVGCST